MLRATLTRRYAAKGKDLMFGTDARQKMLDGVARLSKAVGVTLGPKGRNVIIEQSYGAPKITKDGVTVAKAIEFKDPFENLGAQLVRQVASVTNDVAGDGTTTSTILANAIFQEGFKCVQQGVSPVEVKRGIDHAVKIVIQSLTAQTKPIVDKNEITQVATISANGDAAIGQLIAAAMERVGKDGVITTADGKTLETELEVVEGMSIDRGFISPYFVTNSKTQKVEFEDCLVLCSLKKISTIQQLLPALNLAVPQNKPLLIIADDIDGEALSVLILNKLQGKLRVAAVKAPGFGDNKTNSMQDIGVFVGAQVVSEEGGISLEDPPKDILGYAKKVTITKESTILLTGGGNKAAVDERVDLIKELLKGTESEYEKEKLQDRLAKLSGGVAMIRVGGASELEVAERKDRVTDALMATRAAVAEGIVAGGGAALLHASKQLEPLLTSTLLSADMRRGIQIVYHAIRLPAQHIADNAGKCGAVIVDKILQEKDSARGYDAANDAYVNMFDAGIVDPTKVVRVALVDASSVAGLMITTEAAITDSPQPPAPAGGGGGGMGGMGGMGGDMF